METEDFHCPVCRGPCALRNIIGMPSHEDFRKAGMTGAARHYPRAPADFERFAAWYGLPIEKMPATFGFYANPHMERMWQNGEVKPR